MVGNVEEWCLDEYDPAKKEQPPSDLMRVYRGGSFNLNANGLRVDNRGAADPNYEIGLVGFRLVYHQSWS